jgi:hypothetical protein
MYHKILDFSNFHGIDNVNDPDRIEHGNPGYKNEGETYFREATNVDITNDSILKRAKGTDLLLAGNYHSFWSVKDGSFGFGMNNGSLVKLTINPVTKVISSATLRTGFDPNARMQYVETDDRVFMTNGTWIGYFQDNSVNNLPDPDQTFKTVMPAGHLIEFYHNTLFVAFNSLVIHSDAVAWHRTDLRKNIVPFTSRIRMIQAVDTGLFVSDSESIWYLDGANASEFVLSRKLTSPVYENAFSKVPSEFVGLEGLHGDNVVMATDSGIYIGSAGGSFIDMTKGHYVPQAFNSVCGYTRIDKEKNQVLFIGKREIESLGGELEIKLNTLETRIH